MNIIQVCPYDLSKPGGVQTHIAYLSRQLIQNNHKVLIIAPGSKSTDVEAKFNGKVINITTAKRIHLWGTSIDLAVLSKKEKEDFKNVIEDFSPDVIHFHTVWNPFMQTQMLRLLPEDVKKVATFHDTPPDFGVGKHIGANLMKIGVKYYLPKIDVPISVSKTQAKAMGFDEHEPGNRIHLIPNGIDASLSQDFPAAKRTDDEFRIVFIGRFEERKGIFDLLEVFQKLVQNHPKTTLKLRLIGNGPQMEKVQEFVNEHQIRQNVQFFPSASDEQKNELIANSDLMVAPSLYGESFGIVLLEAMTLKVKVTGYGNAGYLNIGTEYGAENFPKPGDKSALFSIIEKHLTKPEKTDYLIEKGMQIARRHDWAKITEHIEQLYQKEL